MTSLGKLINMLQLIRAVIVSSAALLARYLASMIHIWLSGAGKMPLRCTDGRCDLILAEVIRHSYTFIVAAICLQQRADLFVNLTASMPTSDHLKACLYGSLRRGS